MYIHVCVQVDELCAEWRPEPLVPPAANVAAGSRGASSTCPTRVISGPPGAHVIADGRRVLNLVSTNFLGFAGDRRVSEACRETIVKYGCGSAGPRGFYGTIDVHLELERRLAKFFGVGEAILYSFGVATMTSLIPAYAKRGDLIVCDAGVNYALQSGVILSRSTVKYFAHNDVEDLERLLRDLSAEDAKKGKLRRKFVVIEGIYSNYGDIAALDKILPLCHKYKFRLLVDESMSIGVLGATGRGCFEHFGLEQTNVEILTAAMGHALGSVGGFCCGDKEMIAHQRLGGNGYVFSASLPPFLATASIKALDLLASNGAVLLPKLHANAAHFRGLLRGVRHLCVDGDDICPIVHVRLDPAKFASEEAELILNNIVIYAFKSSVLLTTAKYSRLDRDPPPPSIRVRTESAVSHLRDARHHHHARACEHLRRLVFLPIVTHLPLQSMHTDVSFSLSFSFFLSFSRMHTGRRHNPTFTERSHTCRERHHRRCVQVHRKLPRLIAIHSIDPSPPALKQNSLSLMLHVVYIYIFIIVFLSHISALNPSPHVN